MTKQQHMTATIWLLQDILAQRNARNAAQKALYEIRARMLTKGN